MPQEQVVSTRSYTSSVLSFFSGTLFSRITGLTRDVAMAWCFGADPAVAAFMVAFRFSNLLRRLFGEGALHTAFVPLYESLRKEDSDRANRFFIQLASLITLSLLGIIFVAEAGMQVWMKWGAPSPGDIEILRLTSWMFPGILFICLYGISSSFIQCHNRFFVSSVAPALFNIVWIGSLIFLKDLPSMQAMTHLSQVVVAAYMVQWLLLLPSVKKLVGKISSKVLDFDLKQHSRLIKAMSFSAVGVGAVQINAFFDALFARWADLEGPAWLWYALRLQQVPLALFGIACAQVLLPPLSRAIKEEGGKVKELFNYAKESLELLLIPCTAVLILFSEPIVRLIYGRGEFGPFDQKMTAYCLSFYALSLVPSAGCILYAGLYSARHEWKIPMKMSLISVGANLILNALFVFGLNLGSPSVAIATSISAFLNYFLLGGTFNRFTLILIGFTAAVCLAFQ